MSKKYDFSAFEKPAPSKKKGYDFSAFADRETAAAPAPEEDWDLGSMANTAVNELAQGITLNSADEIEAGLKNPMGGAKSLLGLLGMDNSGDKDVQAYTQDRDKLRTAYEASAAKNPGTALVANIAGSFVPGMGITKLIGPAAKGATSLQKIWNAMKVGGVAGGTTAVGTSDADLAKGEVLDLAADVGKGTALGGGLGGVIQGGVEAGKGAVNLVKGIGKGISNFRPAQEVIYATERGFQGEDLTNMGKHLDRLSLVSEGLGENARKLQSQINGEYSALVAAAKKDPSLVNLKPFLEKLKLLEVEVRKVKSPELHAEVDDIMGVVKNYTEGLQQKVTVPMNSTTFTPKPAVPGLREKLEKEISKLVSQSKQQGENARYNIAETFDDSGNKMLNIVKVVDEPIGASEKLVMKASEKADDIADDLADKVDEVDPFFKSWGTNGPKEVKKANELAATLNSKAQHDKTGKIYKVFNDDQHGVIHVMEIDEKDAIAMAAKKFSDLPKAPVAAPKAAPAPKTPPEMELIPTGDTHSTSLNVSKPQFDYPAAPASVEKTNNSKLVEILRRSGGSEELPKEDLFNLQKLTGDKAYGQSSDSLSALGKNFAKDVDTTISAASNDSISGLQSLNKKRTALSDSLELFGLKAGDAFETNHKTGEISLSPKTLGKIAATIRQEASETAPTNAAIKKMNLFLDNMEAAGMKGIPELRTKLTQVGKDVESAKLIAGKSFNMPGGMPVINTKNAAWLGNTLGRGAGGVTRAVKNATPEWLKATSEQLITRGGNSARVGKMFGEMANKDDMARNALLFSMMQQPWARETIEEIFGKEDKDETK